MRLQFYHICPAGMLAYGEFSFSSNSSEASQAMSNTLKANYGLNSLSLAVNAAKQVANSSAPDGFYIDDYGWRVDSNQHYSHGL